MTSSQSVSYSELKTGIQSAKMETSAQTRQAATAYGLRLVRTESYISLNHHHQFSLERKCLDCQGSGYIGHVLKEKGHCLCLVNGHM
jgi:hypothetical protein